MTFNSLLNTSCHIGSYASSQNYLNEYTYTWTYATAGTKCRMDPVTASDRIEFKGKFEDVRYRGFFKSSSGINLNDRVKYQGKYYEIVECYFDSSFHHKETLIAEL